MPILRLRKYKRVLLASGRWLGFALFLLCVQGCASRAHYAELLEAWVHESPLTLYRVWGYPSREDHFEDGVTRLRYESDESYYMPRMSRSRVIDGWWRDEFSGGYWVRSECVTDFFLDSKGRIDRWEMRGDGCGITRRKLAEQLGKLKAASGEQGTSAP